ncbi:MAG TPA: glycosyl hydrolase family 28-related protein [Armatimonadota bacterium]|jgi:hypothetical protein
MRSKRCSEGLTWDEPRYHREHYKIVTDFGAVGDGVADDTQAIQDAIDYHAGSLGDKHAGIVFFPAGTYKLSDSLLLWKGMHLLCDPQAKATLILPAATPGFAGEVKAMIQLTCGSDQDVTDHTHYRTGHGGLNWVFHTALRNLDFIIEEGNPAAVVAWWWADHDASIEHSHLLLKSGRAAVWMPDDSGRIHLYKCLIEGGEIGFFAGAYSMNSVVACTFRGQSEAAMVILNSEPATLVKDTVVEDAPVALRANTQGGVIVMDCDFRRPTSGAAIDCPGGELLVLNTRFTNCQEAIRDHVPGAACGEMTIAGYTLGATYLDGQAAPEGTLPYPIVTGGPDYDLADMYADEDSPGSVIRYGAVGDGVQDDSRALQAAIDDQEVVFLPMGQYRLEQTVRLRANTKLIGQHRSEVRLLGPDGATALETPDTADAEVLIKEIQMHSGGVDGVGIDWRCGGRSVLFMVNTWTEPGGYTAFLARGHAGGTYLFAWGGGFQGDRNHGRVFEDMEGPMRVYGVDSEHSGWAPYVLRNVGDLLLVNWQTEARPRIGASVWCENCHGTRLLGGLAGWGTGPLAVRLINCERMQISNFVAPHMEAMIHETRADGTEIVIPAELEDWGRVGFYGWRE